MNRRAFLADGGRTVAFAVAAGAARTELPPALEQRQPARDDVEGRVGTVIQAYDAQGNHRTGTKVDQACGGRFVTLVCGSDVYHNVADRWPEAVDVANLARYARAFANGVLELAQQE